MPVLGGTNVDPRAVNSTIDRESLFKEGGKKAANSMREELAKWSSFEGTRTGQIVCSLVDPMIGHLRGVLAESTVDLMKKIGVPSKDAVDEYRAECRGALKVWESILYRSQTLEGRLDDIKKFESDEEDRVAKKRSGDDKVPEEVEEYV